jgi:hypothetical protein
MYVRIRCAGLGALAYGAKSQDKILPPELKNLGDMHDVHFF